MRTTCIVAKSIARILAMLVLFSGVQRGARAQQIQGLVDGNTSFGLNLYGQLAASPGNLFFSPYSISTCLAMTYMGARGTTEQQMAEVLGFDLNQAQFSSAYGLLLRDIEKNQRQNGIQLNVADALWTQRGYPFLIGFLETARAQFQAGINQADFITSAEPARLQINQWVAQETMDKIQNILPSGSLDPLTRLVLANAIYFKGAWAKPFDTNQTASAPFYLGDGGSVTAELMHQPFIAVNYMESSQYKAVELPYGGGRLSMVILLPSQADGLDALEGQLDAEFVSSTLGQMKTQAIELFLPRFTLQSQIDLSSTLSEMGMPDAFLDGVADFSGIDGKRVLSISHVFHKAWGQVDEAGTEAAAATVVVIGISAVPVGSSTVFRADHPFIFFIRDVQSNSVLFLGRVADPAN